MGKFNIAILEIYHNGVSLNTIDAYFRTSIILQKELNCRLFINDSDYDKYGKERFDCIIVPYTSYFAPFDRIAMLLKRNPDAKVIWIVNEYDVGGPSYRNREHIIIANYEDPIHKKNVTDFHCINLNILFSRKPNPLGEKKYDICYYGTFRIDRQEYFRRYFDKDMFVSTSTKNIKRFQSVGCNSRFIKKFTWKTGVKTLNLFKVSLYIEDRYTHTHFNNLANRWYESGYCNNVVLFDASCENTIRRSEIGYFYEQVKDYMVSSKEELHSKMREINKNFEKHLAIQKCWCVAESQLKRETLDKIKEIIYA
jgi:hypothetical protein